MIKLRTLAQSFWRDSSGQDLIEYALIAAVIAMAAVAAMKGLATGIEKDFNTIAGTI